MTAIKRFFSQAWLDFKARRAAFSLQEFLFFQIGYPLVNLIFYCLLAGYSFNTSDLTHWVVGNSFLLCVFICVFSLGVVYTSERRSGRIRSIISSPSNKLVVVLQNGIVPIVLSVVTVFVGFIVASAIFGVRLYDINMGLFLLTVFCGMFAAMGFGLFLSVLGLISDSMHFVLNLTSYILMIFCGANFPISQLWKPLQFVSRMLPLTDSIKAADMLFGNMQYGDFFMLLGSEILTGAVYLILAALIVKLAERYAVKHGTLEGF